MGNRLSIRARLITLMLVPAIALVAVTAVQLLDTRRRAATTARFEQLVGAADQHFALLHALQEERVHTVDVRYVDGSAEAQAALEGARSRTDDAVADLRASVDAAALAAIDPDVAAAHDRVLDAAERFAAGRQPVDALTGNVLSLDTAFGEPAAAVLEFDSAVAPLIGDPELAARQQVAFTFTRLKAAVVDRLLVELLAATGQVDRSSAVRQVALLAGQQVLLIESIERLGTEAELQRMSGLGVAGVRSRSTGPGGLVTLNPAAEAARVDNGLLSGNLPAPAAQVAQIAADTEELRATEVALADGAQAVAREAQRAAARELLVIALVTGAAVLVTLLALLAVTRGVVGPLRRLTRLAQQVGVGLPGAVEAVAAGAPMPDSEFNEAPNRDLVRRGDELGDLARAIRASTETAVLVATEQAQTRAGVAKTIMDVARREQSLVEQQLALLDRLEDDEANPEQLANLFGLDHLATRMRRNAENLLLFASGELPGGPSDAPTPLVDVVRSAAAETEDYVRVDVAIALGEVVNGYAATPLSHLLAELVENATSYSPPSSRVAITAARVPDGVVVRIRDHGIGMDADELEAARQKLAETPLLEAAESRRLGLYVVGLLAARLGIAVTLSTPPDGRGTLAEVRIPDALLAAGAPPSDGPSPAAPARHAPEGTGAEGTGSLGTGSPWHGTVPSVPAGALPVTAEPLPPIPDGSAADDVPAVLPTRAAARADDGVHGAGLLSGGGLSLARESGGADADLDQGLLGAFFDSPPDPAPEPAADALPQRAPAAPAPPTQPFSTPSWAPPGRGGRR